MTNENQELENQELENQELENQELELTETVDPISAAALYQADKAAIDTQVSTAKAYPRSIRKAVENSQFIVSLDKETAQTCTYTVPRGGKKVTGPSVHLAKILAQNWGNMRVEARIVEVGQKTITSEAVAFDLENNLAIKASVKRSIWGKHGRFSEDMITVTGNAANSISMRNAILSVIPRPVVDKVYKTALQTITGDLSDDLKFAARRQQILENLVETYKVTEEQILAAIGRAAVKHITREDLVSLIGIGTAIKDGDTTIDEAFRSIKKPKTKEEHEAERWESLINDCKTENQLNKLQEKMPEVDIKLFNQRRAQIKNMENREEGIA